jgi:putative transposase
MALVKRSRAPGRHRRRPGHRVKPMLDRVPDWSAYLSSTRQNDRTESIRRHNRTGRPLGSAEFIQALEQQTGKTLAPKRPGPKPYSTS